MALRPFETLDRDSRENWRSATVTRDFIKSIRQELDALLTALADAVQVEDTDLRSHKLAVVAGQLRALKWVLWLISNEPSKPTSTSTIPGGTL